MKNKIKMRMIEAAIMVRPILCFVWQPSTLLATPTTLNLFENPVLMNCAGGFKVFHLPSIENAAKDLCTIYCCFVMPIIKYVCPVQHFLQPIFLSDEIEHIQNCATKIILLGLSYTERLTNLNLPTLQECNDELCCHFLQDHKAT